MALERRSFTLKASGILPQLLTPCFATVASRDVGAIDRPTRRQFSSLWDTGATFSTITRRVVEGLRLQADGYITLRHAGDAVAGVPIYHVDLLLYNSAPVVDVRVGLATVRDIDVIIGMDIINLGDFAVSNREGATAFSFRIPSVEDFDFVKDDEARKN